MPGFVSGRRGELCCRLLYCRILAERVFITGRSWQCSPVPFLQTAESGRKLRRLINGCGCGSVDYVSVGAQIQRENPSARHYRFCVYFSGQILRKLWCLHFSVFLTSPFFVCLFFWYLLFFCLDLLFVCVFSFFNALSAQWSLLPFTPCSRCTRCPPANTTSPRSGVPLIWNQQRKEKKKYCRQKCTCSRMKVMLSPARQQQELWPCFCTPPDRNPWFWFSGHFLGFKTAFFCREGKKIPAFTYIGQHFYEKPALYRIFI